MNKWTWIGATLLCWIAFLSACQSIYYDTMERFGIEKREIMVDRVEDARDAQVDAKEQFLSALDQFQNVVRVEGGELEDQYERLKGAYQRSVEKADRVRERVERVEDVSEALFAEWQDELEEYENMELRRASRAKLDQTRKQYRELMVTMHRAEERMAPFLESLQDQVLFLKHNLNARAIASLEGEVEGLQAEVQGLIRNMERSIAEAEAFIRDMS